MMMELKKGKEPIPIQVEAHMMGIGRMGCSMARVYILGLMVTDMRGSSNKDRELAMVFITMLMVTCMRESSNKARKMAGEDSFIKTIRIWQNMMGNGLIMIELVMEQ